MEGDPFALIEAMTIAAYATGCERGYVYIRGEYPRAAARARGTRSPRRAAAGYLGDDVLGEGFALRHRDSQGRGRLHLRRGDGDLQLDRGQPRRAAQQAAVPGRRRACSASRPSSTTSRRWSTCSTIVLAVGPGLRRDRHRGLDRDEAVLPLGHVERPGVYEVPFGDDAAASCSTWPAGSPGGTAAAGVLMGGAAGGFVRPRRARPAAHLRGRARGEDDARLGRRARVRRDGRPAADADADRGVLPQRVVRPVRAVPRRHGAPGGGARAARLRPDARRRRSASWR